MRVAKLAAAVCVVGCRGGATGDLALDSLMRVEGAQFVAGPMPDAQDGPSVASVDVATTTIWPGDADKPVGATLGEASTAAGLALSGDRGFWVVVAGAPDFSTPTLPSLRATASFSVDLAPGPYILAVRAIDAAGRFGPPNLTTLTSLVDPPSLAGPEGALVVTLTWDTEADLDLHVVDPAGEEVYHGKKTTLDGFSPGQSSSDGGSYGYLDVDSNAGCRIDGRRSERVVWIGPPPSGRYLVRVDAADLCGQPIAHYKVRAFLNTSLVGQASGVAVDADTWGPHDRGAGVLALSFDVP